MATDLQEWVHELCRDYMRGRLDSVLSRVDDDIDFVIYAPPDIVPPQPRRRGQAALAAILLKVQSQFEYLSYQPFIVGGEPDTAAVVILARLKHRATGTIIPLFIANFVRFRDGRMVEMREFVNRAECVEQLFARKDGVAKQP